jgi:hypothetical protein
MPKHVKARAAQDEQEERLVRKLANSHHAPADWKWHAQMVLLSWAGKTPNEIAAELDCHPQTVRIHLGRFTAEGVAGLLVRSGSGRKPRLSLQPQQRPNLRLTLSSIRGSITSSFPPEPAGSTERRRTRSTKSAPWFLRKLQLAILTKRLVPLYMLREPGGLIFKMTAKLTAKPLHPHAYD